MISLAIEKGNQVIVYNEKNKQIACVILGGGKLLGYTASSFSIKRGCSVYTYDERGRVVGTKIG